MFFGFLDFYSKVVSQHCLPRYFHGIITKCTINVPRQPLLPVGKAACVPLQDPPFPLNCEAKTFSLRLVLIEKALPMFQDQRIPGSWFAIFNYPELTRRQNNSATRESLFALHHSGSKLYDKAIETIHSVYSVPVESRKEKITPLYLVPFVQT